MKWKRKGKQVFAMMLAVATLLSGCAPNGIVFRWGYTCDYTQQGGAGNPFFMRFLSTVLGSSPVYRSFFMQRNPIKCGVPLFFVCLKFCRQLQTVRMFCSNAFAIRSQVWLSVRGLQIQPSVVFRLLCPCVCLFCRRGNRKGAQHLHYTCSLFVDISVSRRFPPICYYGHALPQASAI